MPPGFMNASCAPALCVYASCASPMTSPSADSPAVLLPLVMSAVTDPTIALAMGAIAVLYLLMIAVSAGSAVTSRVTILLSTLIDVGWAVSLLIVMSMSVTNRPKDDALLTGMFWPAELGSMQLYALCV